MFKQIKKLTALFFVAATLFSFTSCKDDEEDINPSVTINEADLVGEWGWPTNHAMKGRSLKLNANHTVSSSSFDFVDLSWTLEGNKLVCMPEYGHGTRKLDLTIKSIVDDKMEVEGELQATDVNGNVVRVIGNATGTMIKTVTTQSPTLTDGIMVGGWYFEDPERGNRMGVNIDSDHTFHFGSSDVIGTWSVEGSKFIGTISEGSNEHEYSFTVGSMTTSATKVVLKEIDGMDGDVPFGGTFTKKL